MGQLARHARNLAWVQNCSSYPPQLRYTFAFRDNLGSLARDGRQAGIPDIDTWNRVSALLDRYRRLLHYHEEIKPQWEYVNTIHWADNSIEIVERSNTGKFRHRMTTAPHGDRCF
jgi:hypothetical protein